MSDLVSLGAIGKRSADLESATALDFAGTFAQFGRPLATLAIWTVVAVVLIRQWFRWDDRG